MRVRREAAQMAARQDGQINGRSRSFMNNPD